jgi:dissimilatory sulfite reductase (desulfoviridin) alpha/beta subunit
MTAPDSAKRIDFAAPKSGCIIMQKDDDFFAIRLRLPGGGVPADQLPKVAGVARKYGRGEVRLTARQRIEIPWVRFCEIEAARRELAEAGLALGLCGPRFRTVTACPNGCSKPLENELGFCMGVQQRLNADICKAAVLKVSPVLDSFVVSVDCSDSMSARDLVARASQYLNSEARATYKGQIF